MNPVGEVDTHTLMELLHDHFAYGDASLPFDTKHSKVPQNCQLVCVGMWCVLFMSPVEIMSWTQSATSSITSFKSKVPQVNPVIRPACDPEKQGARAKPSGDLDSRDQIRNKSPDPSRVTTCDKSQDLICFGRARSPLINKWQTVGMVCNQRRHVTPVIE